MHLKLIFSSKAAGAAMNSSCVKVLRTYATRLYDSRTKFLPSHIRNHLFGANIELEEVSEKDPGGLFGSLNDADATSDRMTLPPLCGQDIRSHVNELSERQICAHRDLLKEFLSISRPPIPSSWVLQPGWMCYREGCEPESVEFPPEDTLCFDAEVCVKEGFAPVLACAVSSSAWYCWVSSALIDPSEGKTKSVVVQDLIPLGDLGGKPRIVIGHYVCYDSARIQESYKIPLSGLKFFDTMAAHISVSGITDRQKYYILNSSEKPEWADLASGNSLKRIHYLYCGKDLDKSDRDVFVHGSLKEIAERFQELCTYCAKDVEATHSVFCNLFPLFMERFPHGATLAAMCDIGCMFVPVGRDFGENVHSIKQKSSIKDGEVKHLLQELATDALGLLEGNKYLEDPWMWDQDWTVTERERKRKTEKGDTAYPGWYRKLLSQGSHQTEDETGAFITYRMNIAAKLMQLCWGKFPLHYERYHGWGMLIPATTPTKPQGSKIPVESITKLCKAYTRYRVSSVPSWRDFQALQDGVTAANSALVQGEYGYKVDREEGSTEFYIENGMIFKKLPHSISIEKNVGGALSSHLLMNPSLRSGNVKAQNILTILRNSWYWKKFGKDIETLPVVWFDESLQMGAVVPSIFAFSDFSRQPREKFFTSLICENHESYGVEICSSLLAPEDWCFLTANLPDVDMWMTSLLADSVSGSYCSSGIGKLFLDGEVYSTIAGQANLTTLQAEWILHAVMWGANKRYLAKLLREVNPVLSKVRAYERAETLLDILLENSSVPKPFKNTEVGGVLSCFHAKVASLYKSGKFETPFLESRLSRVFESNPKKFSSLVQNWLLRSSVVDYLHVLMLCFRDLMPASRMCTVSSFKGQIKYLVPKNEKYHAAKSLHSAHLYATAFCAAQVGLSDVPKIAAELPYVTLSSHFKEDFSNESERLTFLEAFKKS